MFCLVVPTDPAWASGAARDLDAVLVDHAHCEMKAASHAMSLVVRYADDFALVMALTDLAREELDHFRRVVDFLDQRGLRLGAPPVDEYAAALRRAATALPASPLPPLVDRLLVSALIEARSCERFKLLQGALDANVPRDLVAFYEELFAAEARHYRTYVDLAHLAARDARGEVVEDRLAVLAAREGAIVAALAAGDDRATVHG
jgi:tRNA-(ms[2]io[6]A)-hydroxylase